LLKRFLIRLLLGKSGKYFDIIKIKGKLYEVDIRPYESAEKFISRMKGMIEK